MSKFLAILLILFPFQQTAVAKQKKTNRPVLAKFGRVVMCQLSKNKQKQVCAVKGSKGRIGGKMVFYLQRRWAGTGKIVKHAERSKQKLKNIVWVLVQKSDFKIRPGFYGISSKENLEWWDYIKSFSR